MRCPRYGFSSLFFFFLYFVFFSILIKFQKGFFFIFFGISLTAWCFVIAGIMFYAIVFNKKVLYFHLFYFVVLTLFVGFQLESFHALFPLICLGRSLDILSIYYFIMAVIMIIIISFDNEEIFGIVALATESIGYGPPLAWCFIHFDGFGYNTGGLSRDYPLFCIFFIFHFTSFSFLAFYLFVLSYFISLLLRP